jgi:Holliday junction DNA helicase RuvA
LEIPLGAYYALNGNVGTTVSLHVHTRMREESLTLYGFVRPDERTAFEHLTAISGVGPRLALAVLSGIGVEELRDTVFQQDRDRLQQIPGVGKKTAERVLLELRDRLEKEQSRRGKTDDPPEQPPGGSGGAASARADAISALENLGYGRDRAERAVRSAVSALDPDASLEAILRGALSGLVR